MSKHDRNIEQSHDLRELVIEFLGEQSQPCSALHIAKYVLDLNGTTRDVNRVLMDLEREGYVRHYETRPVTWFRNAETASSCSAKL